MKKILYIFFDCTFQGRNLSLIFPMAFSIHQLRSKIWLTHDMLASSYVHPKDGGRTFILNKTCLSCPWDNKEDTPIHETRLRIGILWICDGFLPISQDMYWQEKICPK